MIPPTTSTSASLRRMVSLAPARADHIPAFRIALGLAGPLALLLLTGRIEWSLYASFGAFTGIYSRYEPTRVRFRRQGTMAVLLTACVGLGAHLADLSAQMPPAAGPWIRLLAAALVAGASATFITRQGIRPGGAVFPVFAISAVAAAPPAAPVPLAVLIAGASAAWCVLLGLAGHWAGERHPDVPVQDVEKGFTRAQLTGEFARYAAAALIAGVLGVLSGLPSPYWAQIAAVVPLSAPRRTMQVERGLHRMVGTALGVVVTAFLLSFPSQPWQLAVWVVLLQFLAELYVLRNYSLALLFITPLALLMIQLAHPQPAGPLLQARVLETVIGGVVGIGVVVASALWARRGRRAQVLRFP